MCSTVIDGPGYLVSGARKFGRTWQGTRFLVCDTCYSLGGPRPDGLSRAATLRETPKARWDALVGHGEQMPPTPCEACGAAVVRNRDPRLKRITCSDACAVSLTRTRNGNQGSGQPCETCGQTITTGRADSRYCGSACRQKAYRRRKAVGGAPIPPPTATAPRNKNGRQPRRRSGRESLQAAIPFLGGLADAMGAVTALSDDVTDEQATRWAGELEQSIQVIDNLTDLLEARTRENPNA
jgi:hypothetical protein